MFISECPVRSENNQTAVKLRLWENMWFELKLQSYGTLTDKLTATQRQTHRDTSDR